MQSVYHQVALNDSQAIRILTLDPGDYGSPLSGTLTPTNVEEAKDYEPLSYVWGDPKRTHNLHCPTGDIPLTGSLYNALQRLRPRQGHRRLWVDQICINQDDKKERSQQVQFMNTIYKKASRVLVWLGEDDEGMAVPAFELVRALAKTFEDHESRAKFDHEHHENVANSFSVEWNPLKALTKRPWFTRTWIVQEIGTKAPATLFWGDANIDWYLVHTVCEELTTYHHLRKTYGINTAEIKYVYRRFIEPERTSRHANRFSFIYELHRARHLKVTDPRDRVFAFLGHYSIHESSNQSLRQLTADYIKTTVEEVYIDVATSSLQDTTEPLIALAAVQHESVPSKDSKLPSWVPDWRTYQAYILSEPTSPHLASGTRAASVEVDASKNILQVRGIAIDTVEACSHVLRSRELHVPENSGDQDTHRPTIERLWQDVAGEDLPFHLEKEYNNGESAVLAFMQTLSNGCVATWWQQQSKLPEEDRSPYSALSSSEWLSHAASYLTEALPSNKLTPELSDRASHAKSDAFHWSRAANGASTQRVFARTREGYYVLGPKAMEVGDVVCVLFGGKMPFSLRPWKDGFLLVGECYVHGMMNGEVFDSVAQHGRKEQSFEIL